MLPPVADKLPQPKALRFTRPLTRFLEVESAGGIVLILAATVAVLLANSPAAADFQQFWHTRIGIEIGAFRLGGELGHFFVNDVLMTIFFFVVGLEIKRELVSGELREWQKAALPVFAAAGGMVVPAGLYMVLRWGEPDFRGWGIPMATDIAFVVGAMALLGKRVPFGLKIVLLSLAIADDIGAVLVIAVCYSGGLDFGMLGLAVVGFGLAVLLNRAGVRSVPIYLLVGVGIWLATYKSGVHPTVAGVMLGLLTPASAWIGDATLVEVLRDVAARAPGEGPERFEALTTAEFAAREGVSPLERLETALHPWVGYVVMPLFALANAGVSIQIGAMRNPVAFAVALGLLLGKPVGIVLFSWVAIKSRAAKLPSGVTWSAMLGGGCLAGIGFTMSLFVAGLAFEGSEEHLAAAKIGILCGSCLSALAGATVLALRNRGA